MSNLKASNDGGDCPRCGETNIHNKETKWECQDCLYSWKRPTTPTLLNEKEK